MCGGGGVPLGSGWGGGSSGQRCRRSSDGEGQCGGMGRSRPWPPQPTSYVAFLASVVSSVKWNSSPLLDYLGESDKKAYVRCVEQLTAHRKT